MAYSEAVTEVFRFLNRIFGPSHGKQVRKVVAIYDTMAQILDETSVERILILRLHNGGEVLKSTGEMYVSVLYENYDEPFHSIKAVYQRVEVDREYARMILRLMQDKKVNYKVANMPEGFLKNVYLSEGVKSASLHYLGQDRRNIYFTSSVTSQDGDWMTTPQEFVPLEVYINIIKQNIK